MNASQCRTPLKQVRSSPGKVKAPSAGRLWGQVAGAEECCAAFESRQHCLSVHLMPRQTRAGRMRGEGLAESEVRPQGGLRGLHRAAVRRPRCSSGLAQHLTLPPVGPGCEAFRRGHAWGPLPSDRITPPLVRDRRGWTRARAAGRGNGVISKSREGSLRGALEDRWDCDGWTQSGRHAWWG